MRVTVPSRSGRGPAGTGAPALLLLALLLTAGCSTTRGAPSPPGGGQGVLIYSSDTLAGFENTDGGIGLARLRDFWVDARLVDRRDAAWLAEGLTTRPHEVAWEQPLWGRHGTGGGGVGW